MDNVYFIYTDMTLRDIFIHLALLHNNDNNDINQNVTVTHTIDYLKLNMYYTIF